MTRADTGSANRHTSAGVGVRNPAQFKSSASKSLFPKSTTLIRDEVEVGVWSSHLQQDYQPLINHRHVSTKEAKMSRLRTLHPLPVILVLAGALPGCATYGKRESGGCSGYAKITTNVQGLFDKHPELGPPNLISVQTRDHVVYLSGEVSAGEFRDVAESVAHEAPAWCGS
jgi:hypothetical protein